jgi:DNA-binding transcriptional MerR regulator
MLEVKLPPDKRYFSIGEVSEIFQVNPSLIRFWEKEFEALKPKKTPGGSRKYSVKDVELLKTIYFLVKERGYTLEGARKKIEEQKNEIFQITELSGRLLKIREELIKLRDSLA